jgi:serine/threonine-protein kinase
MSDSERTVFAPRHGIPVGTRLNGIYEIERLIAVGGMGEVYKGRAIQTGDAVAIKMIRPDMARNENALALFRKEAAALHNLYNEAIVRYYVFTIDPVTESPYLAMEFVDGQPLSDRIKQGPLSFEEVDVLRRRIASGLHAAHLLGIVHRDVSPDNIILPGGQVARAKIIDFGIARSTQLGEGTVIGSGFAGKYNYVSPEQLGLGGGEVTGQSDIYSLGLVLAEALAGRPLDMGGTQVQVLEKRRRVPDLAAADARLRPLLAKMLAPDPAQRPADMASVAAWQAPVAKSATGNTSALRIAAGVAIAAVLAGGGYALWSRMRPAIEPSANSSASSSQPRNDSAGVDSRILVALPPLTAPIAPELTPPAAPSLTEAPAAASPAPPAATGNTAPPKAIEPALPTQSQPQVAVRTDPPAQQQQTTQIPTRIEPQRPPPEPRIMPPTPTATVTPPPLATQEPRTPADRIQRYISGYDGGACFFLWPLDVAEKKADLEGFGSGAEAFVTFDAAFKQAQGFEATINLRPVTAAQCLMVDFLRQLGQAIDRSPRLQIGAFSMKSGDILSGTVDSVAGQNLDVVLIGDDGLVYNLASYLKRDGTKTGFNLKLESSGTTARPQVVLALVSQAPFAAMLGPNPAPASEFFPNLARDIAASGGKLGLGIKYFRIQ